MEFLLKNSIKDSSKKAHKESSQDTRVFSKYTRMAIMPILAT